MKELTIEWKHYDKEGETCTRCNDTGESIRNAMKTASSDPVLKDLKISFVETRLKASEMQQSNSILFNGVPIEAVLNAKTSENYCHSCSCLAGEGSNCRTIEFKGETYEAIPEEIILMAIKKSVQ